MYSSSLLHLLKSTAPTEAIFLYLSAFDMSSKIILNKDRDEPSIAMIMSHPTAKWQDNAYKYNSSLKFFRWDYSLAFHTTNVLRVVFHLNNGTYSFKSVPNDRFFFLRNFS